MASSEQTGGNISFSSMNTLFSSYENKVYPLVCDQRKSAGGNSFDNPPSEKAWLPFMHEDPNATNYAGGEVELCQAFNFYYSQDYSAYGVEDSMPGYLNGYITDVYSTTTRYNTGIPLHPPVVLYQGGTGDGGWASNMLEYNFSSVPKIPSSEGNYSIGWLANTYFLCSEGYPLKKEGSDNCTVFRVGFGNISTNHGSEVYSTSTAFNDVEYDKSKLPAMYGSSLVTVPVCSCKAKFPVIDEEGGGDEVNVYPQTLLHNFTGTASDTYGFTQPFNTIAEKDSRFSSVTFYSHDQYSTYSIIDWAEWTVNNYTFLVGFTPIKWKDYRAIAVTRIVGTYKGLVRPAIRGVWFDYLQRAMCYAMGYNASGAGVSTGKEEGTAWKKYVEMQPGESSPIEMTNQPYNRFDSGADWFGDLTGPKMIGALGGGLYENNAMEPGSGGSSSAVSASDRFKPAYINKVGVVCAAYDAVADCKDGCLNIDQYSSLSHPWFGGSKNTKCNRKTDQYYNVHAAEMNQLSEMIDVISTYKIDEHLSKPVFLGSGGVGAWTFNVDRTWSGHALEYTHFSPTEDYGYLATGSNGCAKLSDRSTYEIANWTEQMDGYQAEYYKAHIEETEDAITYEIPVNIGPWDAGTRAECCSGILWTVLATPMQYNGALKIEDITKEKYNPDSYEFYDSITADVQFFPPGAGIDETVSVITPGGATATMTPAMAGTNRNRLYARIRVDGVFDHIPEYSYSYYAYSYSYSEYSYSYSYVYSSYYLYSYSTYSYSVLYSYSYASEEIHEMYPYTLMNKEITLDGTPWTFMGTGIGKAIVQVKADDEGTIEVTNQKGATVGTASFILNQYSSKEWEEYTSESYWPGRGSCVIDVDNGTYVVSGTVKNGSQSSNNYVWLTTRLLLDVTDIEYSYSYSEYSYSYLVEEYSYSYDYSQYSYSYSVLVEYSEPRVIAPTVYIKLTAE